MDPSGFGRFEEELELWARNGTFEQKLDFLRFKGRFPLWETEATEEKAADGEDVGERTRHDVAEIFMLYGEKYRAEHGLSPEQGRAMFDIERCRTADGVGPWRGRGRAMATPWNSYIRVEEGAFFDA